MPSCSKDSVFTNQCATVLPGDESYGNCINVQQPEAERLAGPISPLVSSRPLWWRQLEVYVYYLELLGMCELSASQPSTLVTLLSATLILAPTALLSD